MLLTLIRSYKEKATPGTLFINGTRFCFTLELPRGEKGCIPEGEYPLHLTFSPKFKTVTPQLMDVPGRSNIRIHWGNFLKDTQGCPLVGYEKGVDEHGVEAVYNSQVCFNELTRWLKTAQDSSCLCLEVKSWDK